MTNYIRGSNPFSLSGPPAWWLSKLWDFDDSLVVFPSKMACLYRLAQRRPPDPRVNIANSISTDSDSRMLASHGCVPVTTIIATAKWDNPLIWEDLRQRCPTRMGGAEKFEALLDAKEQMTKLDELAQRDDTNTQVSKDAWGYYLKKAGLKSAMWTPKTPNHQVAPANRSAGIKIASKYEALDKYIKKPTR